MSVIRTESGTIYRVNKDRISRVREEGSWDMVPYGIKDELFEFSVYPVVGESMRINLKELDDYVVSTPVVSIEGTAQKLEVTRTVSVDECPWLPRDFEAGEVVYVFSMHTYGCISASGMAATQHPDGYFPFIEFPRDAVESFK